MITISEPKFLFCLNEKGIPISTKDGAYVGNLHNSMKLRYYWKDTPRISLIVNNTKNTHIYEIENMNHLNYILNLVENKNLSLNSLHNIEQWSKETLKEKNI